MLRQFATCAFALLVVSSASHAAEEAPPSILSAQYHSYKPISRVCEPGGNLDINTSTAEFSKAPGEMSLKYAGRYPSDPSGPAPDDTELYEIQSFRGEPAAPPLQWLAIRRGNAYGEVIISRLEGDTAQKASGRLRLSWECTFGPY